MTDFQFKHNRQDGTTLIEVLVTIVLLGIGLLGLASMQNISLKYSYDSYLRTQSALIASDMFDRIRANPTAQYDDITATTSVDCTQTTCAPATMMQYDMTQWAARVDETFPGAATTITSAGTPINTYTIAFKWESRTSDGADESATGGDDDRAEFSYTARVSQ